MATNSTISVTPGSGKNVATYSIVENTLTKELQRIVISDSNGSEYNSSNPFYVSNVNIQPGGDPARDIQKIEQQVSYLNGTTSQQIVSGAGKFMGWMVNSHTSGTLKFWDSTSGAGTVIFNTITFASGPSLWVLPVAISFLTGLFVTSGGTIDYTILYKV